MRVRAYLRLTSDHRVPSEEPVGRRRGGGAGARTACGDAGIQRLHGAARRRLAQERQEGVHERRAGRDRKRRRKAQRHPHVLDIALADSVRMRSEEAPQGHFEGLRMAIRSRALLVRRCGRIASPTAPERRPPKRIRRRYAAESCAGSRVAFRFRCMRPGKQRRELRPNPSTALSRTPATQRSEVEGYPGSSATTCREAAPTLAFRKGLLQGNQIHPCQLLAPPSPRSAKPSGGRGRGGGWLGEAGGRRERRGGWARAAIDSRALSSTKRLGEAPPTPLGPSPRVGPPGHSLRERGEGGGAAGLSSPLYAPI